MQKYFLYVFVNIDTPQMHAISDETPFLRACAKFQLQFGDMCFAYIF